MKRRLVTLAAVASLVLCVATVALWVRSYWRYDTISYVSKPRRVGFDLRSMGCRASSGRGLLWIGHFDVFPTTPGYEGRGLMWYAAPWNRRAWADSAPKWRHFGMRYWHEEFSGGEFTYVGFSYWHIIGPPAFLLCLGAVAARTRQNGCCRTCGYDLRATPKRGAVPVSAVECLPP